MARLRALFLVATVSLVAHAAPARASSQCWRTLLNDYFRDGQLDHRYPVSCYETALAHLSAADATIYGSAVRDVRHMYANGLARVRKAGAQVGPTTLLPAEHPGSVGSASGGSKHVASYAIAGALLCLLVAWAVIRWRHPPRPA